MSAVPLYCLDSNVFIQAKNVSYHMEVFVSFWKWLDDRMADGTAVSVPAVYDELLEQEDELTRWVREGERKDWFVAPSSEVQERFSEIADYVRDRYTDSKSHEIARFLDKADPWIIAQARSVGAIVVTQEIYVKDPNCKKIKIPNVCERFGVKWMNIPQMLLELKARL